MLDTEGTMQTASFENRVFGEHASREPRSTYLYPLWPALAILVPSLLPPLLWLQYTLAPIKAINPGVRHAFDYEYIETIGWSLALSAVLLSLLNLLLLGLLIWQLRGTPHEPRPIEPFVTWGTMLLLGLFYLLTVYLDLFIGIAVVMFAMCLLWGERRLHVALGVALLTPLCVFALFDKVLQIRFPRGILTNWYYG